MHRSSVLAVAALLLLPAAAHADTYLVDATLSKARIVETTCPDGSITARERSTLWSAEGSGELPGNRGILALLKERLTATGDFPAEGEPVKTRDLDLLSERDRGFGYAVSLRGGRVVIDFARFSPLKRKQRVKPPRPGGRKTFRRNIEVQVEEAEPDANGCVAKTIRSTDVDGSVQVLSS